MKHWLVVPLPALLLWAVSQMQWDRIAPVPCFLGEMCISQLCYNIFYICIRIRLSKVAFVIQAKRIHCDSVFRRSSLQSPGQVESPYGNCCTHITRLRFLVELTQTELLTEVMQKFGQEFCPGLTPSSHQALAATCSFPHQWDRREKWKGES